MTCGLSNSGRITQRGALVACDIDLCWLGAGRGAGRGTGRDAGRGAGRGG